MQRVTDVWQVEVYGYRCPKCEKLCKISSADFGNHPGIDGKTALVVCEECGAKFLAVKPED